MRFFRTIYNGIMDGLVWIMKLVHHTVGITIPKPEYERTVALLWVAAVVGLALMTSLLGYFFISNIASDR